MLEWLQTAGTPSVVRRALTTAFVVGTILIVINHGDALLRLDIDATRAAKMGLTVMVPYLVSTISSVQATRVLDGS